MGDLSMVNDNRAKDELEKILNQSEYQVYYQDNRNFLEIWWENFKSWISDLLTDWLSSFQASSGVAKSFFLLLLILGVSLFVLVIFLLVRRIRRKRRFKGLQPLQSNQEDWSYDKHLKEANVQETKENYSVATRHLFLALLLYFDDKEWLVAKIWKTNWEYYDELFKVNPEAAEQFFHLALIFDQVTYGERSMDKLKYDEFKGKVLSWFMATDNRSNGKMH